MSLPLWAEREAEMFKSELQHIFETQQTDWLGGDENRLKRHFLKDFRPTGGFVEVITGVRRSGKSTLMRQIAVNHYANPAFLHFEDTRLHEFGPSDFEKLTEVMGPERDAYFFDEIQNISNWELYVRQLHDRGMKVYVTGSNASLLGGELATKLTGRHLQHELFPFSYPEFLEFTNETPGSESWDLYQKKGGFPEFLKTENGDVLRQLLRDLVLRDIAVRHGVRQPTALMDLVMFLVSNAAKEHSLNSLKKALDFSSVASVSDYVGWMEDAWFLLSVPKFSRSAKKAAANPKKYYGVDTGFLGANSLSMTDDYGRMLENAVYLGLRRKGVSPAFFRENRECDFVFSEKKKFTAVQVCAEVHSDNLPREVGGLEAAAAETGSRENLILTRNQDDSLKQGKLAVKLVPAWQYFGPEE